MEPPNVLIAYLHGAVRAKLMLDFEAALFGIRVLRVPLHGGEIEQDSRGESETAEDAGENGSAGLRRREADADLA
jgi:hypothetical protein